MRPFARAQATPHAPRQSVTKSFTLCEVRRHCTAESCWLVAGRDVYDVTEFLPRHPAGTFSIVRHSGGRDCSDDISFHSNKAAKLWDKHKIGRLTKCSSEGNRDGDDPRGCTVS